MNWGREQRLTASLAFLFACITGLASLDLISDVGGGVSLQHAVIEAGILLLGVVGLGVGVRRFVLLSHRARQLRDEAHSLELRLEETSADAERWRRSARDLLAGLSAEIDRQFARWALTPAEKEVALLLLKGLSHKEIASVREVGEATTRQQARAVYKKAELSGRHDLSAFFLEDLMLPRQAVEVKEHQASKPIRSRS